MSPIKIFSTVLLLSSLSLLSSCSSKKGGNASSLGRDLSIDALQVENCLSVEKLVNHFNRDGFQAPGRKITYDLYTGWRSDQFFIYNFGISDFQMTSFPMIKNAVQADCSTVVLENAYGRHLHYRVIDANTSSISLVRDKSLGPTEPVDVISDAYNTEPELKSLKIQIESPTSVNLSFTATTLRTYCSSTKLYEYSKGMRVRWGNFPAVETIDPNLVARARQLIPQAPPPLVFSAIAMASENTTDPIIEEPPVEAPPSSPEAPPISESPPSPEAPVDEVPPVTEEPPIAEAPPTEAESPPTSEIPSAPEAPPLTDQFSVQEIIDLQNRIRQIPVSTSCST